jgi:hypothetical protein
MSGDIILDEKQKHALYFAGILKAQGFHEAAEYLEENYSPFRESKNKCRDAPDNKFWQRIKEFED